MGCFADLTIALDCLQPSDSCSVPQPLGVGRCPVGQEQVDDLHRHFSVFREFVESISDPSCASRVRAVGIHGAVRADELHDVLE